jgi:hypothetical protein
MKTKARFPETPEWLQGNRVDDLFVFTHIPKAAGTSFSTYLGKIYGRHLGLRYSQWATPLVADDLEKMSLQNAQDLYAFSSHMRFGVERRFAIQSERQARQEIKRKRIIRATILRDPVERIFSAYHYIRSAVQNERHDIVKNVTFKEFLSMEQDRLQNQTSLNLMCWMVTGKSGATFEDAKTSIERNFHATAVVEHSEEMINGLKDILGWPDETKYVRKNTTRNKPDVGAGEIEEVRALGLFDEDQKLFDYVAQSGVLLNQPAK